MFRYYYFFLVQLPVRIFIKKLILFTICLVESRIQKLLLKLNDQAKVVR